MDEARREWRRYSLPDIVASEIDLFGTLFVYLESHEGPSLQKASSKIEDVGGSSFRCDGTSIKRTLLAVRPEALERLSGSSSDDHLEDIFRALRGFFRPTPPPIITQNGPLTFDRTRVMGILNVTPDSFSDGGRFLDRGKAFEHAMRMVDEGADILDIGGESTRPYSEPTSEEIELERVVPLIKEIASSTKVPISIDTMKPNVAIRSVESGASIVNDISGLRDQGMIKVVADLRVPIIIMHMLGEPRTMQVAPHYEDIVGDISLFLRDRVLAAEKAGIDKDHIIIDPGLGFGKTIEDNLEIVRRLSEFKCLDRPILIGASRKGFIGKVLGTDKDDRLEGSLAVAAVSAHAGANIVRVHDVKPTVRTLRMTDALDGRAFRVHDGRS